MEMMFLVILLGLATTGLIIAERKLYGQLSQRLCSVEREIWKTTDCTCQRCGRLFEDDAQAWYRHQKVNAVACDSCVLEIRKANYDRQCLASQSSKANEEK